MARLNVIGNGFDLYHGMPSSYYYFGCFLIGSDPEFYSEIGDMYKIKTKNYIGPSIAHFFDYGVEKLFWSDFESHLGEVDENYIVGTNNYDLGLENDDPIDIDMYHYKNADKLKEYFAKWINETLDISENYCVIKDHLKKSLKGLHFNSSDSFITFNYTHTLQEVYGISEEKIYYMHGECSNDLGDELIVGHGNNDRIAKLNQIIIDLNNNYRFTQPELNEINEYKSLVKYLENIRKDVQYCIDSASSFYKSKAKSVDVIRVIGLSLGDVDIPYLLDLQKKYKLATWEFSYYSTSDSERIKHVAENMLMLPPAKYSTFQLLSATSECINDEIVKLRGIIKRDFIKLG